LTSCSDKVDENSLIPPPDWESYVAQIAADIVEERTPQRILQVRAKFYDLLTHCIPASTVLKVRAPLSVWIV
jgi:replication factor C subunit 3/5